MLNINFKSKKIWIVLGGILTLAVLLILLLNYQQSKEDIPQDSLGVEPEIQNKDQQDKIRQSTMLQQKVPIKTPQFTLDYDQINYKFTVNLSSPQEESRKIFETWLKENNFDQIPTDEFIFL